MPELEYFRNHLARLNMIYVVAALNNQDTKQIKERIKNCELELSILENE